MNDQYSLNQMSGKNDKPADRTELEGQDIFPQQQVNRININADPTPQVQSEAMDNHQEEAKPNSCCMRMTNMQRIFFIVSIVLVIVGAITLGIVLGRRWKANSIVVVSTEKFNRTFITEKGTIKIRKVGITKKHIIAANQNSHLTIFEFSRATPRNNQINRNLQAQSSPSDGNSIQVVTDHSSDGSVINICDGENSCSTVVNVNQLNQNVSQALSLGSSRLLQAADQKQVLDALVQTFAVASNTTKESVSATVATYVAVEVTDGNKAVVQEEAPRLMLQQGPARQLLESEKTSFIKRSKKLVGKHIEETNQKTKQLKESDQNFLSKALYTKCSVVEQRENYRQQRTEYMNTNFRAIVTSGGSIIVPHRYVLLKRHCYNKGRYFYCHMDHLYLLDFLIISNLDRPHLFRKHPHYVISHLQPKKLCKDEHLASLAVKPQVKVKAEIKNDGQKAIKVDEPKAAKKEEPKAAKVDEPKAAKKEEPKAESQGIIKKNETNPTKKNSTKTIPNDVTKTTKKNLEKTTKKNETKTAKKNERKTAKKNETKTAKKDEKVAGKTEQNKEAKKVDEKKKTTPKTNPQQLQKNKPSKPAAAATQSQSSNNRAVNEAPANAAESSPQKIKTDSAQSDKAEAKQPAPKAGN